MPETIIDSKISSLMNVSLFSDFKQKSESIEIISQLMTQQSFKSGDFLIRQNEKGNEFFVLTKGKVVISKTTPEGDSYPVVTLDHHQHPAFGEGGLMGNELRSANIICESDVECLVLSREGFDQLCEKYPHIAVPIFRKIAQALMVRLNQTSNDLMLLHKALMNEIRSHD
jgi:CRP-like cAMP-binding protein